MNPTTSRLTSLLGTASFLALSTSISAQAQQVAQAQIAQPSPQEVPEQVPITGSRFRGTAAAGVGAITNLDLFRSVPEFNVIPGPVGDPRSLTQVAQAQIAQAQIAQAQVAQAQVAQAQMAQAQQEVPEQVLITGSLIRGTVAVGVPVTNLGAQDFKTTGALSTADLFRSVPQFNVGAGPGAGTIAAGRAEGGTRVNLRQLDTGTAPRNLMMIDGMRFPPQDQGLCQIEPDIIPVVAIDRIDLLLDGASATYGSDAIGGVFNVILKRAYDGAVTEAGYKNGAGGNNQYFASQLWGRTWDGGDITLSYEWRNIAAVKGTVNSRYSFDFTPFGLDDRTPIASSTPGTISTGGTTNANDPSNNFYPAAQGPNCTNCFAIPKGTGRSFNPINGGVGPTAPFSGSTLNWTTFNTAANTGTNGTRNRFNPYSIVDYTSALQFSGAALTVDQRLTKNISFYGEGLYGMRRSQVFQQANANQLNSLAVPTINPYYPTGGAPNNLRVAYHMSIESPSYQAGNELSLRYQGGLNIDLPSQWAAQISYSMTRDQNWLNTSGSVNKGAVSAALGWTMPATVAIGTRPGIATWTKPATVPYLNLFCDPLQFQCNSPSTLAYIGNFARSDEAYLLNEKSIKADGPLFDLPGGTVKAAIGANYITNHYIVTNPLQDPNNTILAYNVDAQNRSVWAGFAQLNIPIFSDMNAIPGFRRLEFEASWRHDQYSDFGGTSNSKIGFNWAPIEDLTVRGGWGTSFRAPNFGENSLIVNAAWNGFGLPTSIFSNNASISISCTGGKPVAGSGSEKLFKAGFACGSQPAGMSFNGGRKGPFTAGWRDFVNQSTQILGPEKSLNYSIGFDYAPTTNFLKGLDVQATWYSIKISDILVGFGNPTTGRFSDAALGFVYLVPSDLHNAAGVALCPGMDLTPQLCAPFQAMVQAAFSLPNNTVPSSAQTLIYWLNDGGTMNKGWQRNEGFDYNISYDWDWGDIGAFNVGVAGTYVLKILTQRFPGEPIIDGYHDDVAPVGGIQQLGVVTPRPRDRIRTRLGWANSSWTVTGFMNYEGHFYHTQTAPPNVNFQCLTAGATVGATGGSLPCAINNYNNIEPSYITFDLSAGYDTGDEPVNDYLKHVSIQLTVDNVLDKQPAFEYRISTGGGNPSAFDILKNIYGRVIGVRVTKTW
ncbi:MAG TPA: TonB-dependent receptor [Micropepsaceae bacterium]|nr:TonB-dependent receptor [Micropepsaceae bacterium]